MMRQIYRNGLRNLVFLGSDEQGTFKEAVDCLREEIHGIEDIEGLLSSEKSREMNEK